MIRKYGLHLIVQAFVFFPIIIVGYLVQTAIFAFQVGQQLACGVKETK
jgi:hypothetical protein